MRPPITQPKPTVGISITRKPTLISNWSGQVHAADGALFASVEEFRAILALGVARVLAQSPFARPPAGESRFGLKPRIAARDKWRRIEGIQRLKNFLEAYRDAWEKRRSRVVNVVFPAGTYLLRILHGVQCAGAA